MSLIKYVNRCRRLARQCRESNPARASKLRKAAHQAIDVWYAQRREEARTWDALATVVYVPPGE